MCSGRVDLSFVLRAFSNGMDGVFIGGCHLNECHYITNGNHHAYSMVQLCKKLMQYIGLNPERLRIEQMSAGEGIRYAELMNDFSARLHELGPIGEGEGIEMAGLKFKLEVVTKMIPYIRLVERERLRVHFGTAEEYYEYFKSDEVNRLFQELIFDKLAIGQILALLRESPRS
jgi:F420-non-reducing hydrogenase iron-sulfur subunit